jgi:hypothetical protein
VFKEFSNLVSCNASHPPERLAGDDDDEIATKVANVAVVPYAARAVDVMPIPEGGILWHHVYSAKLWINGKILPLPALSDKLSWDDLRVSDLDFHLKEANVYNQGGDGTLKDDKKAKLRRLINQGTLQPTVLLGVTADKRLQKWHSVKERAPVAMPEAAPQTPGSPFVTGQVIGFRMIG